ncbi:pectin esterase [Micrococcales bacterium 31B]|nr:pectin esterase [Micrococcales bacterium 31B]
MSWQRNLTFPRRAVLLGAAATTVTSLTAVGPAPARATQPTGAATPRRASARRIVVTGDSTASTYAHADLPRAGWGQALPARLHESMEVTNFALSGASTKSFIARGLLDAALAALRPGDLLLVSFGHNDEKLDDPTRGTKPRGEYQQNLRRFVEGARARRASVALVTPVERRRFATDGTARATHGEYPAAMLDLASDVGVACVDLTTASRSLWQQLGPDATLAEFLHLAPGLHPQYPQGVADDTHFAARGALTVAGLVLDGLVERGVLPAGLVRAAPTDSEGAILDSMFWPRTRPTEPPRRVTVGGNSGSFASVQAALDSLADGASEPVALDLAPGVYREPVHVRAALGRVEIVGGGAHPRDTVIVFDRASGTPKPGGGTWGTSGSATLRIDGPDVALRNLTVANDFDEAAHPDMLDRQAVALHATGDRAEFSDVVLLGNQDTLLLNSPRVGALARSYLRDARIVGDVDFIFGRGTAAFERCEVESLDRGAPPVNGYVTAASGDLSLPFGFLFAGCTFTAAEGLAPDSVYLGRPWHPSGDPRAIAQVVVRDSWLGAHMKRVTPWTDMSGFSWRDARFFEYANRGPGWQVSPTRPTLTAAQAANFTVANYLAGPDHWAPQRRGSRADTCPEGLGR